MTTADLLSQHRNQAGARVGLIFRDQSFSFADLDRRSNQTARFLQSIGIGRGDRVALYAANRPEWVDVFFGTSKAGAVFVPVSARLRGEELRRIAADSRPALLIFEHELAGPVEHLRATATEGPRFVGMAACDRTGPGGPAPSWAIDYERAVAAADHSPLAVEVGPADPHSICYTSGTTGAPKGVVLTHANVVAGTHEISVRNFGYSGRDVFLNPTPLAHRAGWARLIQSVGIGATGVLTRRFDPDEVLRLVERHRVTIAGLVPTMIRLIDQAGSASRFDHSSLRLIITTAEGCPVSLRKRVFELFPGAELVSLFGSTESGQIAVLPSSDQLGRPTATGLPLRGVDLRILDDAGREVPAGVTGEIAVRTGEPGTAGVMLGYWNGHAADRSCFDAGWFHTGDCGHLDRDGYLHVTDRKRDMILSGGLNISSREVEDVLLRHPGIADAAVVGVPDATWGESVVAVVVRRPGVAVDEQAVIEHCRASLASYKKPRRVEFVADLPRNAAGKVLKYRIREQLAAVADPADTTPTSEDDTA